MGRERMVAARSSWKGVGRGTVFVYVIAFFVEVSFSLSSFGRTRDKHAGERRYCNVFVREAVESKLSPVVGLERAEEERRADFEGGAAEEVDLDLEVDGDLRFLLGWDVEEEDAAWFVDVDLEPLLWVVPAEESAERVAFLGGMIPR